MSAANELDLRLYQLSLPVLVRYQIFPDFSILAGVSANYNLRFEQTGAVGVNPPRTFDITDEIVRFQPGALGGISLNLTNKLLIDARYHHMLTNLHKNKPNDAQYGYFLGCFQISAGYIF